MIGSLVFQRDIITVSRAGNLKDAVKLFKEESGDKSTRFVLCDEARLEKEIFRRIELQRDRFSYYFLLPRSTQNDETCNRLF